MTKKHSFVVLAYGESKYLEDCIKSVIRQRESEVLIATTTPNDFISKLAKKYNLVIKVGEHTNIGGDFDFAISSSEAGLITIAHQDDIYEENYAEEIISAYEKNPESLIIFSDYYEIRNSKKVETNANLKIKRLLLFPVRIFGVAKSEFTKRNILRFGCAISCPAVTFVKKNCPKEIFASKLQCNVDWNAWEKLSRKAGAFTFVPKKLMGHRISEDSTTTDSIKDGIRTKEDMMMYQKFWPKWMARILAGMYKKSEDSNSVN